MPALPVAALDDPDRLIAAVAATGARHVYVHLDLDVLDPGHFAGLSCPEPAGLHPEAGRRPDGARRELRARRGRDHQYAPAAAGPAPAEPAVEEGVLRRLFTGPAFS
ncbi:arginase family protein [Streptomyces albulus]|nr:arginase family protein [Streptomyces noursei]